MDLKKKWFEIVVITYNGKKGTELKIFEYFGINVIQIFDQIWTFWLERPIMSLTFKRYKFKLYFSKKKKNK